jgi:archaellin
MSSSKLAITYSNARQSGVLYGSLVANGTACVVTQSTGDDDTVLETGETFKIRCLISGVEGDADTGLTLTGAYAVKYESFRVSVRPANGAVLTIERTIPGGVDEYMVLE